MQERDPLHRTNEEVSVSTSLDRQRILSPGDYWSVTLIGQDSPSTTIARLRSSSSLIVMVRPKTPNLDIDEQKDDGEYHERTPERKTMLSAKPTVHKSDHTRTYEKREVPFNPVSHFPPVALDDVSLASCFAKPQSVRHQKL
jgi:hypothetical protein